VKPQNGLAFDAGCVVSTQATPAMLSETRVAHTNMWPFPWSSHMPGSPETAKLLLLASVMVLDPDAQQLVASDWLLQKTWRVPEWWKTLNVCVLVSTKPQPSPPPLEPTKLDAGGAGTVMLAV
jgi:hypothetical protein